VAEKGGKDEKLYKEVAVRIAEGFCTLDDLDKEERRRVVDLQKMAAAGKRRLADNLEGKSCEKGDEMGVDRTEGEESEKESAGRRRYQGKEFRDDIRRMAEERIAARGGGGGGQGRANRAGGDSASGQRGGRECENESRKNEESDAVPLQGEERYEESDWAIARLKRGDESGCVGVKPGGGGRCSVTSFERTRDRDSSGVLVLFK
jgi:hypothetical protein